MATITDPAADKDGQSNTDPKGQPEPGAGGNPDPKADNGPKGGKDQLLAELAAERDRRQKAEQTLKDQELAKLPELERAQAKLAELEQRAAAAERKIMQRAVADKLKLPAALAETLVGETESEMEKHAAKLAPYFRQEDDSTDNTRKPPNDAKKPGAAGKPSMSDLLRAAAGYGS